MVEKGGYRVTLIYASTDEPVPIIREVKGQHQCEMLERTKYALEVVAVKPAGAFITMDGDDNKTGLIALKEGKNRISTFESYGPEFVCSLDSSAVAEEQGAMRGRPSNGLVTIKLCPVRENVQAGRKVARNLGESKVSKRKRADGEDLSDSKRPRASDSNSDFCFGESAVLDRSAGFSAFGGGPGFDFDQPVIPMAVTTFEGRSNVKYTQVGLDLDLESEVVIEFRIIALALAPQLCNTKFAAEMIAKCAKHVPWKPVDEPPAPFVADGWACCPTSRIEYLRHWVLDHVSAEKGEIEKQSPTERPEEQEGQEKEKENGKEKKGKKKRGGDAKSLFECLYCGRTNVAWERMLSRAFLIHDCAGKLCFQSAHFSVYPQKYSGITIEPIVNLIEATPEAEGHTPNSGMCEDCPWVLLKRIKHVMELRRLPVGGSVKYISM